MPPTYNVHLYREMRLFFPGIVADTPEQAAARAAELPDDEAAHIEDCEGINLCALVDLVGDDDFSESVGVDFDHGRTIVRADQLHQALQQALDAFNRLASNSAATRLLEDTFGDANTAIEWRREVRTILGDPTLPRYFEWEAI
jgi:hypothetical protein